jgi:predicted AlkP superfamily phosphohydrolase/phosphomutase
MSKLVIIGIDGLDPLLLNTWKESLPNIGSLFQDPSEIIIESTFPPDSICAWASIYTGENPAEHGLLESIDYLSGKNRTIREDRAAGFRGRTFWDLVGKSGKSVCVINPFIAYPAWKVNGVMVSGPVFEGGITTAYPEKILSDYKFPPLGGMVDFPAEKEIGEFSSRARVSAEQLADVSLNIYDDMRPDLFFLTFLTLDRIKHFLWKFTDKSDNYYPGENEYEHVIKEFYQVFDRLIGRFVERCGDDTTLIVISDHGHRRRCSQCLNLNEVLRKYGHLSMKDGGASWFIKKQIEKMKVHMIEKLSGHGLQDWIYRIARLVPNRKALKRSTYLIDTGHSSVSLSDLCGTNPYGGLDVRAETIMEYEESRNTVIQQLMALNKELGKTVVKWAKRREELYRGKNEDRLPDVVFELDEDYGVGRDLFSRLITPNYSHGKISGGHKREAVFMVHSNNDKINESKKPVTVIEIKDYILRILDE